jgi:hypothetical protein
MTLRLDGGELAGLDELVKRQNAKLWELRLSAVVTRATYLRSLLHRELESLGLRAADGHVPTEPESLVLVPPRKKLRRSMKKLPGALKVERRVSKKTPAGSGTTEGRRTIWERIIADDVVEDPDSKKGRSK